jgi:teichuronic acid biosynthesis glycosyltransferase TuaH
VVRDDPIGKMIMASTQMLVYLAGNPWDGVVGTDRRLATALADSIPVLWVDPPPASLAVARRWLKGQRKDHFGLDQISSGMCRLRVLGPPGLTRPLMRSVAAAALGRRVKQVVQACGADVAAVVLATPEGRFPRGVPGRRVYYLTDDWAAGAPLMGLSRRRIDRLSRINLRHADIAAAVTPDLVARLAGEAGGPRQLLLPNGCDPTVFDVSTSQPPRDLPAGPFAIVIGQINERLDLAMLEAVADAGVCLVVIGPRTERDPARTRQLDVLFSRPSVHWLGRRRVDELPSYLRSASVGLTPYADNAFNRGSFPLKTLEYLAAGLPVVSSNLPATQWLNTQLIKVSESPEGFANEVRGTIVAGDGSDGPASGQRRNFAGTHTWRVRADSLLAVL